MKNIIILFLFLSFLTSCDPENQYIINGNISDINTNKPIKNFNINFTYYPLKFNKSINNINQNGFFKDTISSLSRFDSVEIIIKKKGYLSKKVYSNKQNWKIEREFMKTVFKIEYGNIKLDRNQQISKEEMEIGNVAISFHKWYIKNTNEYNPKIATNFKIYKDKNGFCKVNFEPYFNELRKLGTISEIFLNNEIERNKECVESTEKLKWNEYDEIPLNCDDYDYWTQSQDFENGNIKAKMITKKDDYWNVLISLYITRKNVKPYETETANAKVRKENGKYMLTEIKWIEK